MRLPVFAALATFCLVAAAPARAEPPSKPVRLGLCAACHGEKGIATMPGTPHLAGQDLTYLKHALDAYRSGGRDAPIMRAAVGALTAAELDELAAWYAAQARDP